jgi:hypothetical protein
MHPNKHSSTMTTINYVTNSCNQVIDLRMSLRVSQSKTRDQATASYVALAANTFESEVAARAGEFRCLDSWSRIAARTTRRIQPCRFDFPIEGSNAIGIVRSKEEQQFPLQLDVKHRRIFVVVPQGFAVSGRHRAPVGPCRGARCQERPPRPLLSEFSLKQYISIPMLLGLPST